MTEKEYWSKHFRVKVDDIEVCKYPDSDWSYIKKRDLEIALTSKTEAQMLYYQLGELLGVNDK